MVPPRWRFGACSDAPVTESRNSTVSSSHVSRAGTQTFQRPSIEACSVRAKTGAAMNASFRIWMLSGAGLLSVAGGQASETTYGFGAGPYAIEMTVVFPEPYAGRPLVVFSSVNPHKPLCYSGDGTLGKCLERFVGAVALVRYSIQRSDGRPPDRIAIRERVTVLSQSRGLPDRPAFTKTIELVHGVGSDLQVFGYDESEVKKSERTRTRLKASRTLWRLYRQELFMGAEENAFAVVEWKHTLDHITILGTNSPTIAGE
jgi:hypothetical protein